MLAGRFHLTLLGRYDPGRASPGAQQFSMTAVVIPRLAGTTE
jgi:hypothetical protein